MVVDIICLKCTLLLAGCSQEKLKELEEQCRTKGLERKLEALKSFIGEKEYVPETRKVRSNMVGKGPVRTSRPARHEIRA